MSADTVSNFFVHSLLRAHDWQHRPQLDDVCQWWRNGGRGVLALVGMGGAGKTAIVERFLRVLPGGLPDDPDVPKDSTLPTPHGVFVFSFYDAPNPEAFFESLQMWLEDTERVQVGLSLQQMIFLLQRKSGLMVLDGLEKVQEDGVRGLLGRLASPMLREFLDRMAAGYFPELSVLVTSRFPLADLRDARPQFFRSLPIEEIDLPAGVRLLRARGVNGTNLQLEGIVEACGRHALTVDFAGGYIAEFGGGDPATPVDFDMDSERLRQRLDDEPDEARRHVLKQGHRFARLAERYREAMRGDAADRSEGDAAALALLERICLFRLGVEAETLANIFTGKKAVNVSGPALAGLSGTQLQKKLDWLVRMRIVESQSAFQNPKSKIRYSIHPAVRDGFLSGIADEALRENHEAVRMGLEVSLGNSPGQNPSDSATLDLLEEIVFHSISSGHVRDAWNIYVERMGGYDNLGRGLGAFERGLRVCSVFGGSRTPQSLASRLPFGRKKWFLGHVSSTIPALFLDEPAVNDLLRHWGHYSVHTGDLNSLLICLESSIRWSKSRRDDPRAAWCSLDLIGTLLLRGRIARAARIIAYEAGFRYFQGPYYIARMAEVASLQGNVTHSLRAFNQLKQIHGMKEQRSQPWFNAITTRDEPTAGRSEQILLRFASQNRSVGRGQSEMSYGSYNQLLLMNRLGRIERVRESFRNEKDFLIKQLGEQSEGIQKLYLTWAQALPSSIDLVAGVREWGVARDATEILCWSGLLEARIESAVFSVHCSENPDIARPALDHACKAVNDGLKFARDCGYGIYHIDLLLERARLHLLGGAPQAALDDLRTALDDGVPGNEQTGQPELLAATHTECGYAWGIAEGLQLRGEALLLQAAQTHGQSTFAPAKRATLPAAVCDLIAQAETCLTEALARWQPLHDPEPERPDQNFQLDGQQYNYRAAETHGILTELAGGVLTNYPLAKVPAATDAQPHPAPTNAKENAMSKRFAVALSFPGEHRDYVKQIADTLVTTLTKPRVFYDRYYEAELSRPNLDTYLQKIYHDESELVVVVLCKEYDEKEWCGLEFRAIRDLIKKRRDDEIMFVRVADGEVKGVFGIDGYVDAKNRPATEIAQVICYRLALLQSQTP